MSENSSEIISFFTNQTIFLTGGTGFLGKLLIEKLLRVCWNLKKIYILVRPKRGKSPQERFEELFKDPCFTHIKDRNIREKVVFLTGDCNKPRLGLSPEDVAVLTKETSCVFHVAANVKFEQTLKEACYNVTATRDVLELCQKMHKLKIFVYVSTAYSNCVHFDIKEEFYEPPLNPETLNTLVQNIDDSILDKMIAPLLDKWPNTYVYSKSIAENVVKNSKLMVPVAVVRPAIILNTNKEPVEGWIDNYYGIIGATVGAFMGVVRSVYGKKEIKLNLVPADYVCNCILAATWNTEKMKNKSPVVYNFAGKGVSCEKLTDALESFYWDFPSEKYLWYKSFTIRDKNWHEVFIFWYFILANILDSVLSCMGKKPRVVEKYKSINKVLKLTAHFRTHEWTFEQNNVIKMWNQMGVQDQKMFEFDMEALDWQDYFRNCALGIRLYLLKDPIETLPRGQKKLKMLFVLHCCVVSVMWFLFFMFFLFVLSLCFQ